MKSTTNPDIKKLDEFVKNVLSHDFSVTSIPLDIAPDAETGKLAAFIQKMALEYQDSMLRAEQTVFALAKTSKEYEDLLAYQTAIIDNMADGLFATDARGKITLFNPALLSLLPVKKE